MFECWWQHDGFEAWRLRGDLRGASRRWQHRLGDEMWLWLNHVGEGVVWGRDHRIFLKDNLFGCFAGLEGEDWKWTRLPGRHEAEILVMPRSQVIDLVGDGKARGPRTATWLEGGDGLSFAGLMGRTERRLMERLCQGWKSRGMPVAFRRALGAWLAPAAQPRIPRAAACGRMERRAQARSTEATSQTSH